MSPEAEFRALYTSYYPEVHAFCARRVGHLAADDIVSEVFTTAWRKLNRLEVGAERAWLFGIARNVVRNHWRSSGRHNRLIERVASPRQAVSEIPEELIVDRDETTVVVKALRTLRQRDQEMLIMSAWDDLTGQEIAELLGISPNAVHQRLHRAKQRLARAIESIAASDSGDAIDRRGAR